MHVSVMQHSHAPARKLGAEPHACIKGANDRMGNYRKLQGVFKNQFVFEAKWEETSTEVTQYQH